MTNDMCMTKLCRLSACLLLAACPGKDGLLTQIEGSTDAMMTTTEAETETSATDGGASEPGSDDSTGEAMTTGAMTGSTGEVMPGECHSPEIECFTCEPPDDGASPIALKVAIDPSDEEDLIEPPELDCFIDARVGGDADGLALSCSNPVFGTAFPVIITYEGGPEPSVGAKAGLDVWFQYRRVGGQNPTESVMVRSAEDGQVLLAGHLGPGGAPIESGVEPTGEDVLFWSPFVLEILESDCAAEPHPCDPMHRAPLRFRRDEPAAEMVLFDNQAGQLGSHRIRVGESTRSTGSCDGTWRARNDFLIVLTDA
jgi:hypothetical protein